MCSCTCACVSAHVRVSALSLISLYRQKSSLKTQPGNLALYSSVSWLVMLFSYPGFNLLGDVQLLELLNAALEQDWRHFKRLFGIKFVHLFLELCFFSSFEYVSLDKCSLYSWCLPSPSLEWMAGYVLTWPRKWWGHCTRIHIWFMSKRRDLKLFVRSWILWICSFQRALQNYLSAFHLGNNQREE